MFKKEARDIYKKKKQQLSASQRSKMDDLILIQFQQVSLPFLTSILSFYPIDAHHEINTFLLTDYLAFRNPHLQIAYPKINFATAHMDAIISDEQTVFQLNQYGISEPGHTSIIEPGALDAVLVPLLAFDEQGHRVGYGKGFYDKFLSNCREDCLKIGLSYFEPEPVIEDADEFDVPLNICITPQKIYVF